MNTIVTDGLVGYWHTRHNIDSLIWKNISPNTKGQYDSAIRGTTMREDGLYFNGTISDVVGIPSVNINNSSITHEVIFKLAKTNTMHRIFGYDVNHFMAVTGTNNVLYASSHGAYDLTSEQKLVENKFYTITVVHDLNSGTRKLFINGILDKQVNIYSGDDSSWNKAYSIGILNGLQGNFNGTLVSYKIYNRALTNQEVSQNYAVGQNIGILLEMITDNLIGYWHFKNGFSGSMWKNLSPNTIGQHNLYVDGAVLKNDGIYFDGIDDYAYNEGGMENYLDHTIETIVKLEVNPDQQQQIVLYSIRNAIAHFDVTDTPDMLGWLIGVTYVGEDTVIPILYNKINYNIFLHIVKVAKYDKSLLYINGEYVGEGTSEILYKDGYIDGVLLMGMFPRFFSKGTIKTARLYNRALSPQEIINNYKVGDNLWASDNTEPPTSSPPKVINISLSKQKISPVPPMDKATLKFKFDQDVTDWSVMILGSDYSTGTMAGSGKDVKANTEISVDITHKMLLKEDENRINIYGKNKDGLWTPYS